MTPPDEPSRDIARERAERMQRRQRGGKYNYCPDGRTVLDKLDGLVTVPAVLVGSVAVTVDIC